MTLSYLIAWILPLALGSGLWACACGIPRRGATWLAAIGGGFLLGNFTIALMVGVCHGAVIATLFGRLASVAALLAIAAWFAAWRWRRDVGQGALYVDVRLPKWGWLIGLLFVLLAVRAVLMMDEILLRPLYPWDAWWAWSAQAKAWMQGGILDSFVAPARWLDQGGTMLRTGTAYNYPPLLANLELWYAMGAGDWIEPLVNLPWFGLWLALLAVSYGQWRALGVPRPHAWIGMYALGSLPLINVHVALAGYADLWITAAFACVVLAWMRWLKYHERGQLVLALVFLLLMPLVKFEGVVWLLCLGTLMIFAAVPPRLRAWGLAAAVIASALLVTVSYLADMAWLRLARDLLSGATGGREASRSFDVLRALADGLFLQYNWHLFWFLSFGVIAWRWRRLWHNMPLRLLAGALGLAVLFVLCLFLFTPAAKWAESYTAVNRLVLQLVPLAATLCVLLLRDVRWGTSPAEMPATAAPALADTDPATPVSSAPA